METAGNARAMAMSQSEQVLQKDPKLGPSPDAVAPDDRAALMRKLFEDHNRALVNFLAARLNSQSEARDVAQEAYVNLLQLERPDKVGFLRAYLFRVAANIATDHLRHRAVRKRSTILQTLLFEDWLAQPGPDRAVLSAQQFDLIRNALEQLPEKCRKVFVLHVIGERPLKEIAQEMRLTERMLRNYVARGLAHCREALDQAE